MSPPPPVTAGTDEPGSASPPAHEALQWVLDAVAEPMLVVDADGRIALANDPARRVFGYAETDFRGLPVDDLLPERFRAEHSRFRAEFAGTRRPHPRTLRSPVRGLRRDGSEFVAEVSLSPLDDRRTLVSLHDATQRHRAEEALRDSEERYRALVENAVDGIFVADASGRYRSVNPAGAAMLGYTPTELLGLNIRDLTAPAEHGRVASELARVESGQTVRGDWEFRRKDGSALLGEVVARRLPDGRILGILRDITERRHTENALRESDTRFRAMFEQAAVGIAHLSADGRWLRVNGTLCGLLGRGEAELCGTPVDATTHPDHVDEVRSLFSQLDKSPDDHFVSEIRLLATGGRPFWSRLTLSLVRQPGEGLDYCLAVVEDIDKRKETESALRKLRAEMQTLVEHQIARQTAEAIAHDLNQPLVAVSSYTEAAARMLRAGNPDPERLMRALEGSAQQAQRAGHVVRELLAYLHKGETATHAVNLNDVVRNAISLAESNGLEPFQTLLDLETGLPLVRANQVQVERVLVNLILNGVEAMAAAGAERRRIRIMVRTQHRAGIAQVSVTDDGPGLDPRTAARIFEPFYTTKPRGIGMGLSISRALIEAQGGQLWLDPDAGPGATFHFTLPLMP